MIDHQSHVKPSCRFEPYHRDREGFTSNGIELLGGYKTRSSAEEGYPIPYSGNSNLVNTANQCHDSIRLPFLYSEESRLEEATD